MAAAVSKYTGNGLKTFSMHTADTSTAPTFGKLRAEQPSSPAFRASAAPMDKLDPETAATRYLHQALASDSVPSFVPPKAGTNVSEFKSLGTETVPLANTKVVKFRQAYAGVPVYGSLVTVELDNSNKLLSLNSSLGEPENTDAIARISPDQALKSIAKFPGYKKNLADIVPKLYFYYDKTDSKWRLVYIAEDVPVEKTTSRKMSAKAVSRGLAPIYMDYVVDAHTGALIAELPRTPSFATTQVSAIDGKSVNRRIQVENSGSSQILRDVHANVQTFDFTFRDPQVSESKLPGKSINNPPAPWPPAAVSAHANAAAVAAFLRTVLQRNNIDNSGGPMNSSINCVVKRESPDGKQWLNAFWNGKQMVYGQTQLNHDLVSLSVDLDIVGHEMFHGVTDRTARLEYANQSGALNESYSDIFGIIIANLGSPLKSWNWDLGAGLDGGKPFRNMEKPSLFDQPEHMKDFRKSSNDEDGDWGGVHVNSGIHNKAAFLILTAKNGGKFIFKPQEVAAFFYISLTQHLSRTSQFSDSRRGVLLSARTLFRTLPKAQQAVRIKAITRAFDSVGIK